ncbi:DUF3300 domain-containing protein [Propionivibrio limicola]|uniref:DUF3300 domain-containing protein n=1 Tax=Propionivibrio limicola TaxID=167645 RepID=UPI00147906D6|nr:DUF3300 domain-containing protein [Propionivibrio limicola]
MKYRQQRSGALLAALLLATAPAFTQTAPSTGATPPSTGTTAPSKTFSQQELDQLLAPIALYPDALLAQVLMASTYPLEVVQAARWQKNNPKVTGKPLEDALVKQPWDPAVKSLTSVPQVLQQMSERLEWTQKLGDAFLAQQNDVMMTVQSLRAKADAAGNLKSTEQMAVSKQSQGSDTIYVIESPKPEVVYVPAYDPTVVYGSWWYPTPPYYMYPPGYAYAPGLAFATGIFVGAAIWGNCNWGWGRGDVDIDVNRYNNFNRSSISNSNWNHNVEHRKGVAYRDQNVARQYERGGDRQAAQARDNFRGRAESGRTELGGVDRGGRGDAGRPDAGAGRFEGGRGDSGRVDSGRFDSGAGGGTRDVGRNNGLSGIGNAAATRDASQRGAASTRDSGRRSGGSASFSGGGGSRGGGGGRGGGRR